MVIILTWKMTVVSNWDKTLNIMLNQWELRVLFDKPEVYLNENMVNVSIFLVRENGKCGKF